MADDTPETPDSPTPDSPPPHGHRTLRTQVLIAHELQTPGRRTLVAFLQLLCPDCQYQNNLQIPGAHLPEVIAQLQQIVAQYPELCTHGDSTPIYVHNASERRN